VAECRFKQIPAGNAPCACNLLAVSELFPRDNVSWQISTSLTDKFDRNVAGKRGSAFRVRVHGLLKEQFPVSLVVHGRIAKEFVLTAPGRTSRTMRMD
jgi:hypothetical protein